MLREKRYRVKPYSVKKYLLLIKQKQKNSKIPKRICMKPCFKTMSKNIFGTFVNQVIPSLSWNECNVMLLIIHWLLYVDYLYILYYLPSPTILTKPPEQNSEAAAGGILKNSANFTGKHLCWSLSFTKLQVFRPVKVIKRDSYTGVFLWNLRNS